MLSFSCLITGIIITLALYQMVIMSSRYKMISISYHIPIFIQACLGIQRCNPCLGGKENSRFPIEANLSRMDGETI